MQGVTASASNKEPPQGIPDPALMIIQDCPEWWRRNTIPPRVVEKAEALLPPLVEYLDAERKLKPKLMGKMAFGDPGVGKTSLFLTMFSMVMGSRRISARYIKVRNLIRMFRDTWGSGSAITERAVLDELARPTLLLIDDIGVQAGTENERNLVYDVIAEREDRNKPTYGTTNHNLKEDEGLALFQNCVGARVIDRYAGQFVNATTWGPSMRRNK